jgi:anti-sigma factor RsiW
MRCAWVEERLLRYLESDLAPHEWERIDRHLERCERCAAAKEALLTTQEVVDCALRTAAHAPEELTARIMDSVRRLPSPASRVPAVSGVPARQSWAAFRPSWKWTRRAAAAGGALALALGGYFAGRWRSETRNAKPGIRTELAGLKREELRQLPLALLGSDHLEYLANPNPAQIPGPDAREVSRGLTLLLNFPVAAVDLNPEGASLLGGRKCQVHGVPIAFLLYDWKGERVSLYQIDDRKLSLPRLHEVAFRGRRFQASEADGLSYVAWRSGAMNFVMVSGVRPERLLELAGCATGKL